MFCVLSRSKGCCIQKVLAFFFRQARNVVNYRVSCCVSLCVSLRFTAPCAFHCILQRVFHFLFAVSWVGGAAIVLGKRRGVECPLPPCGNVGQVPCFCDNEAFLAYSKHVSRLFVLGYDLHCALCLLFRLDSLWLLGRERRGFG